MKLIIAGATGFVGKEILRHALRSPEFTSIVTLGRRAVDIEDQYAEKLTDLVLDDLNHYSTSARAKLANADACIWTIAVAWTKSMSLPFDEVKKASLDYTIAGIRAISESNATEKPLRFIYFSGALVDRDLTKVVTTRPEYAKLRGGVEVELLEYATKNPAAVQVSCARPGYILGDRGPGSVTPNLPPEVPRVKLEECVAAVLKQSVDGIEQDPILNDDLVRIGQQALSRYIS
ncbi:hypothetical protein BP6252_04972 [Coleophoma cylindrospora]|uniref:NAD(P)-binding domain-containing protein n=1 Tax=Coleophoma cylindrospora TaxID=1849047 RepID=A0A3D8RSA2_9HELO|nr:hypothetical protein BP6252_04972 [Coleophoma cylindrospora]